MDMYYMYVYMHGLGHVLFWILWLIQHMPELTIIISFLGVLWPGIFSTS